MRPHLSIARMDRSCVVRYSDVPGPALTESCWLWKDEVHSGNSEQPGPGPGPAGPESLRV